MSRLTSQEWDLIENGIFLPMVSIILQQDIKIMNDSSHKLKQPYLKTMERALKLVEEQLKTDKALLQKAKIKILKQSKTENFTTYVFLIRGYEELHRYFNPVIRNKVEARLEYYLSEGNQFYVPDTNLEFPAPIIDTQKKSSSSSVN